MGDKIRIPFTWRAGEPIVIEVTGADGKEYEVRLALAPFDVYDSGDPADAERFVVIANVALDARPKGP